MDGMVGTARAPGRHRCGAGRCCEHPPACVLTKDFHAPLIEPISLSSVGFRNFPVFHRFSRHCSYNIFVGSHFFRAAGGGAPRDLQKTAAQRRLMLTGVSSPRRQNPSKIDPFSMHTHAMESRADTYEQNQCTASHTHTVSHRKVQLNTSILRLRLHATLEFSTFEPPLRFGGR